MPWLVWMLVLFAAETMSGGCLLFAINWITIPGYNVAIVYRPDEPKVPMVRAKVVRNECEPPRRFQPVPEVHYVSQRERIQQLRQERMQCMGLEERKLMWELDGVPGPRPWKPSPVLPRSSPPLPALFTPLLNPWVAPLPKPCPIDYNSVVLDGNLETERGQLENQPRVHAHYPGGLPVPQVASTSVGSTAPVSPEAMDVGHSTPRQSFVAPLSLPAPASDLAQVVTNPAPLVSSGGSEGNQAGGQLIAQAKVPTPVAAQVPFVFQFAAGTSAPIPVGFPKFTAPGRRIAKASTRLRAHRSRPAKPVLGKAGSEASLTAATSQVPAMMVASTSHPESTPAPEASAEEPMMTRVEFEEWLEQDLEAELLKLAEDDDEE
ncbi:hypothetical protein BDD12DRAFT_803870 [Trichophaea hybrida]|nr:hypothetical protein BDD12DRAFT_803870 [Trichophaea hybrida]